MCRPCVYCVFISLGWMLSGGVARSRGNFIHPFSKTDCYISFPSILSLTMPTAGLHPLPLCYLRGGQALSIWWQAAVLIHDDCFLFGKSTPGPGARLSVQASPRASLAHSSQQVQLSIFRDTREHWCCSEDRMKFSVRIQVHHTILSTSFMVTQPPTPPKTQAILEYTFYQ